MNKQDIIIYLLKEIDKNIDNVNDSGGTNANLQELTVTANGEYLPATYNADGFSKVTARFDTGIPKVKVSIFRVSNNCIDENGRWEGEYFIDTSECTNFTDFFIDCNKLKRIDVNLDTSKSTSFYRMFSTCTSLQYINTSNWNTSKVTNMQEMFINCSSLVEIDTKNWNVSNVTNTYIMFGNCYKLQSLIGNTTLENVLMNNISAFNGLKVALTLNRTIFDRASLRALINGLADLTGQDAQTLTLSETLIAKLTEEDIAIATAKNWTIA